MNLCLQCKTAEIKKGKKFCSSKCYGKWRSENLTGKNNPLFQEKTILTCKTCNKNFITKPCLEAATKYCCKKCAEIGTRKKRTEIICAVCKKSFWVVPSKLKHATVCSANCRNRYRKDSRRAELICTYCKNIYSLPFSSAKTSKFCSKICKDAKARENGEDRNCLHCGKLFHASPNRLKRGKFCSVQCDSDYARAQPEYQIPRRVRWRNCPTTCLHCGKTYFVYNYELKTTKYCSRECLNRSTLNFVSSIEKTMKAKLEEKGYYPIDQYKLGKYTIDLAFPDQKLAVECDGDYWHNLPAAKEKDARKDKFLNEKGWQVLRLKEHEINGDVESCAIKVCKVLYTLKN